MTNPLFSLLISLGLSDEGSAEEFYPRVRDRDDIRVMRCKKSGVIFLSDTEHMEISHYADKKDLSYWNAGTRRQALAETKEDDDRRARQFGDLIRSKRWLDVGTGAGGILDQLAPMAAEAYAVEPQAAIREELKRAGYNVFKDISDAAGKSLDVVTLFHVFEHLTEPIESLKALRKNMADGGKLVVEVPHAKDFLIDFLNLESFKGFTFWSEHLILHTRQSLEAFLKEAGFKNIRIQGFQRYPLANHLHWLAKNKPGGHVHWRLLRNDKLDAAYGIFLDGLDKTDTLIAMADK